MSLAKSSTNRTNTQSSSEGEEQYFEESDDDQNAADVLTNDVKQRLEKWQQEGIVDTLKRQHFDEYMIGGKEMRTNGVAAYMKKLEARVIANPPNINIARITRSFYSPTKDGQPISNVFRLNYVKNELQK